MAEESTEEVNGNEIEFGPPGMRVRLELEGIGNAKEFHYIEDEETTTDGNL